MITNGAKIMTSGYIGTYSLGFLSVDAQIQIREEQKMDEAVEGWLLVLEFFV
jgi:hypothetical protein